MSEYTAVIEEACNILNAIALDLSLCEGSSEPYDCDSEYVSSALEDTYGCVYRDSELGWTYDTPSLFIARLIVDQRGSE